MTQETKEERKDQIKAIVEIMQQHMIECYEKTKPERDRKFEEHCRSIYMELAAKHNNPD